jgi:hypothetical protein
MSMDDTYIDEHDILDRYRLGTLAPEEAERFEEHLLDCVRCQDEIETMEAFVDGLRAVAARDAAQAAQGRARAPWRWRPGVQVAVASLAACAVVGTLLVREGRLRAEIDRLRAAAPPAPAALPVAVFPLTLVRAGETEAPPVNQIVISRSPQRVILSLDWDDLRDLGEYRATITDAHGRVVFERSRLSPSSSNALDVPSTVLGAGDFVLSLEGVAPERPTAPRRYPFRVKVASEG